MVGSNARLDTFGAQLLDKSVMDLRESLKSEVAAAFGTPPFLAGVMEGNVKYSNQQEQHKAFYRDALAPTITNMCQTFSTFFGTRVVCDVEGLTWGDLATLIKTGKEGIAGLIYTPNEVRQAAGLEPDADPRADELQFGNTIGASDSMDPDRPRAGEDEGEPREDKM